MEIAMKHWKVSSAVLCLLGLLALSPAFVLNLRSDTAPEAPTGFSTPTLSENPGSKSESNGMVDQPTFANDQATFEEADGVDEGLGPVYNARSCTDCHQSPVTGGVSQVSELRIGHYSQGKFVNPTITINNGQNTIPNRSLINDRSSCPEAAERVPLTEYIRTFRMSLNVLGDGFVEAVDDPTLQAIAQQQPGLSGGKIAGEFIQVPVMEAQAGTLRGGRFGWKNQQASLLSFSADAYLNEQGITSRLQMTDTTTVCKDPGITDPEDHQEEDGLADIDHFARFMRATKAPPVDATLMATPDAIAGQALFSQIGCAICHVTSLTTAAAGTSINGGTYFIPDALGNKTFHPYSDFLLHSIGTGDGIVQNGPADTAFKVRTAPLWGLRTHDRLMHDGLSGSREEAIIRHGGEAVNVTKAYLFLSSKQKAQLLTFLNAL
jgi:CxxC motif-containing protein (DUF1111 family)